MTYDADKITTEIAKLKYLWQAVEMGWIMQNHNGGDWSIVHDEIVKLRDQCDLLLSPDYLGDEPQPLTATNNWPSFFVFGEVRGGETVMATDWAEIERCVNLAYEDYGCPQEALSEAWMNCNRYTHQKEERMLWEWSMLFYDGEELEAQS